MCRRTACLAGLFEFDQAYLLPLVRMVLFEDFVLGKDETSARGNDAEAEYQNLVGAC